MFNRSQWNFAHVTTVLLSWRAQNFLVFGRIRYELEHCEFSLKFEFDLNIVIGTAVPHIFGIISIMYFSYFHYMVYLLYTFAEFNYPHPHPH